MIATVTAMTPPHPDVMGLVALGKQVINVQKVTKLILMLNITPYQKTRFKNLNKINTLPNNCKKTQSEKPAKMSDPELSGALLNSVSYSFKNEQEGRVTAVVAKVKYQQATKNQAKQRVEHSARCRPINEVIQVLLDSGSDGNLMFHEKGAPIISPT